MIKKREVKSSVGAVLPVEESHPALRSMPCASASAVLGRLQSARMLNDIGATMLDQAGFDESQHLGGCVARAFSNLFLAGAYHAE